MRAVSGLRRKSRSEKPLRSRKREVTPLAFLLALTGMFETAGAVAIIFGSSIDSTLWLVIAANFMALPLYFAGKRRSHNRHEHGGTSG